MARDRGLGWWLNVVNYFNRKELTDEDYSVCDVVEKKAKTAKDQEIAAFFEVLIENNEQMEPYFGRELLREAARIYGKTGP